MKNYTSIFPVKSFPNVFVHGPVEIYLIEGSDLVTVKTDHMNLTLDRPGRLWVDSKPSDSIEF